MSYLIGIDTGGTYTDAVLLTKDGRVLAGHKCPTTREDLSRCVREALSHLPQDKLPLAEGVRLSTTLATNACVENKGCPARLLLLGATPEHLAFVDAPKTYGLPPEDVLCIPVSSTYDGSLGDIPRWQDIFSENAAWFAKAQALAVAEVNAPRNGGALEKLCKQALEEKFALPVVLGSDLSSGRNMLERGATALLNARLLPLIRDFLQAVEQVLADMGLSLPLTIVMSDGGAMGVRLAGSRPVETVMSGPAASVLGGSALAHAPMSLLVDMGGTTTDVSLVEEGLPATTDSIRIGGWRTQVPGVLMHTVALGGDTRITVEEEGLTLGTCRVLPLCAAARKWPSIKKDLQALLDSGRTHTRPLHEFLCPAALPADTSRFTPEEQHLLSLTEKGPLMIGGGQVDIYTLNSARLEQEGILIRAGMTPTDFMHIREDWSAFDPEASLLGGKYLMRLLRERGEKVKNTRLLAQRVYEVVEKRLFLLLGEVLLLRRYPFLKEAGPGSQVSALLETLWEERDLPPQGPAQVSFSSSYTLVGVGAPIHLFLPAVAQALHAPCILPEHGPVANAVGAALASVSATARGEINPITTAAGIAGYTLHTPQGTRTFAKREDALAAAKEEVGAAARREALLRGAKEVEVLIHTKEDMARDKGGHTFYLADRILATAREK